MLDIIRKLWQEWRIRRLRSQYRDGTKLCRFIARDVRREVIVDSSAELKEGYITVRMRTTNVLYTARGLATEESFGPSQRIAIAALWKWSGKSWGGMADGTSLVDT